MSPENQLSIGTCLMMYWTAEGAGGRASSIGRSTARRTLGMWVMNSDSGRFAMAVRCLRNVEGACGGADAWRSVAVADDAVVEEMEDESGGGGL